MLELNRLFPGSFTGPDGFASWSRIYQDALDTYSGVPLRQGFKEVMTGWDKWLGAEAGRDRAGLRAGAGGSATGPAAARASSTCGGSARKCGGCSHVLADDWFRFNGPEVESFLARFEGPGGAGANAGGGTWDGRIPELSDRQLALQKLAGLVRSRAFDVAMAQASEGHFVPQPHVVDDKVRRQSRQIEIPAEDFKRLAEQVACRRRSEFGSTVPARALAGTLRDGPDRLPAGARERPGLWRCGG